MHADIEEILYSEQDLAQRVREIGRQITEDYQHAADPLPDGAPRVVVACVLRGAAVFMADLVRHIDIPVEMDYLAVSSYGAGVKSSGDVRILKDLSSGIEGRHVIIAEDILDSGLTLECLLRLLAERKPASIQIAALLRKTGCQKADIDCKYVGFYCPDAFVVGYGLDYAERYRNLPYVGVLKPIVYQGST